MSTIRASEDEQIAFLLSCVRNSMGGVNFTKVAAECNIVSVNAAQKRFSRLNKKYATPTIAANSAIQNGAPTGNATQSKASPCKTANSSGKGAIGKAEKPIKKSATALAPLAVGVSKRSSPKKLQVTIDPTASKRKIDEEAEQHCFFDAEMESYSMSPK